MKIASCILLYPLIFFQKSVQYLSQESKQKIELRKKIRDTYFDDEEKAEKFVDELPKNFEINEIVNLVFEQETRSNAIRNLLQAIQLKNDSFTITPFDQIRLEILEDKNHLLNHSWLMKRLQEHDLDQDEDKISSCHKLAFDNNHPYIYPLAKMPVQDHEYTLNFLWVNLNPQDRVKNNAIHIFNDGLASSENAVCIKNPNHLRKLEEMEKFLGKEAAARWFEIKESFIYRLSKWADFNPNAQINLWYDSALVTKRARQNTIQILNVLSFSRGVNMTLRDIRKLPNIRGEIENSLHPGTPVYYRVDILKALISDYMVGTSQETAKYCVVSDIDVEPMTKKALFDERTLSYLASSGYVFNRVGLSKLENSFFIFNREKNSFQKKHYKILIKKTASYIAELRQYPKENTQEKFLINHEFVFSQYSKLTSKMGETINKQPRKVVKCPKSQFNLGGFFSKDDFQSELFRFIGEDNIPYTKNGRNYEMSEKPKDAKMQMLQSICSLSNWKVEPLAD